MVFFHKFDELFEIVKHFRGDTEFVVGVFSDRFLRTVVAVVEKSGVDRFGEIFVDAFGVEDAAFREMGDFAVKSGKTFGQRSCSVAAPRVAAPHGDFGEGDHFGFAGETVLERVFGEVAVFVDHQIVDEVSFAGVDAFVEHIPFMGGFVAEFPAGPDDFGIGPGLFYERDDLFGEFEHTIDTVGEALFAAATALIVGPELEDADVVIFFAFKFGFEAFKDIFHTFGIGNTDFSTEEGVSGRGGADLFGSVSGTEVAGTAAVFQAEEVAVFHKMQTAGDRLFCTGGTARQGYIVVAEQRDVFDMFFHFIDRPDFVNIVEVGGQIDTAQGLHRAEDAAPFAGGEFSVGINAVAEQFACGIEERFGRAVIQHESFGIDAAGEAELFFGAVGVAADFDRISRSDGDIAIRKAVREDLKCPCFQRFELGVELEEVFHLLKHCCFFGAGGSFSHRGGGQCRHHQSSNYCTYTLF